MNKARFSATLLCAICAAVLYGCESPEHPNSPWNDPPVNPRTENWSPVTSLAVNLNDPNEVATVTEVEKNRAAYKRNMQVLASYYFRVGNLEKYNWATSELKNIMEAKTFKWENVAEPKSVAGESLTNADERILVEDAYAARLAYRKSVDDLVKLYEAKSDTFKAKVMRVMRNRLDPIRLYPYFPESMLPPKTLRCTQVDPKAEAMFKEALRLYNEGKGWTHTFWSTSYNKERDACVLFLDLIEQYPTSTRVPLAAYYIGEINKEYFKENTLAVYWYERAWTWDPNVTEPAYFQAATVYDIHLHNYSKAVECYRLAMVHDATAHRLLNYDYSEKRIRELTQK